MKLLFIRVVRWLGLTIQAVMFESGNWLEFKKLLLGKRACLKQLATTVLLMMVCWSLTACQPRAGWGPEQKLLAQVWTTIDRSYVDATFNNQDWWKVRQEFIRHPMASPDEAYAEIAAMLATLDDPFTRFLPPSNYRSLQTSTAGELNGVGLQIALDDTGRIRVIAPLEDTPADRAGLQPDDILLSIDGAEVTNWTLDEVANHLRGTTDTNVYLSIRRDELDFEVKLKREAIAINPVRSKILTRFAGQRSVAYIRLNQFNGNAVSEMRAAIQAAEDRSVAGYILDLRGNPGGLLKAGIEVAQMWIDRGPIVFTINRNGISDSADATASILTDKPLVVLVNKGTASASEVLAGALQDSERAVLVGTRTFGKGLIQSLVDMPDGSGLAVTIAKYATPSGRDINKLGIEPDYVVELAEERALKRTEMGTSDDSQFVQALSLLEKQLAVAR
ncbi:MAG: S41 family peptidase [Cyanobacteria bacterium P01_E01_bin.34]